MPVLRPGDEYHLALLRDAWKHFDGSMMLDRDHASPGLLKALRGFVEATINLKAEFEEFRRDQYLRDEAARMGR